MLATPRHRQKAYATRPAPYGQHDCKLGQPFDFREPKDAHLRPKQVECADCGALWTMHSHSSQRWTTRKEYVVVQKWHPMPPPEGTYYNATVSENRRVPQTVTEHRWVFEPRKRQSLARRWRLTTDIGPTDTSGFRLRESRLPGHDDVRCGSAVASESSRRRPPRPAHSERHRLCREGPYACGGAQSHQRRAMSDGCGSARA
jgi:hypothetical protein